MPVSPNIRSARGIPAVVAMTIVAPVAIYPAVAFGQAAAPSTITPRSLAPQDAPRDIQVDIPGGGALQPPKGAEQLSVEIGDVVVEGGFAEVAGATEAVAARLRHGRHTLAEIYAAASEIEAIHARAGYVLARISVPPQKLHDGGALRLVVTDGFIEAVDVSALPARVRVPVQRAMAGLARRPHLRMRDIEQALVIANDVPGLTMRSTLTRGDEPGGAKLILSGTQVPVSFQFGVNNSYDASLGTYAVSGEIVLNSLLGQGETIYGFIASHYDITRLFAERSPAAIAGGGIVLPIGDGRLTINPELTYARTRPLPVIGAPQTVGRLRRFTLRGNYTLARSRHRNVGLTLTVEQIDATNDAPDFAVRLSHDRFMAARLGISLTRTGEPGSGWGGSLRISQGLGSMGAITLDQATVAGTPFSRAGSSPSFTNIDGSANFSHPAGPLSFFLQARAQGTFGKAQFRSEQFSLEGSDALSAYTGGIATTDEGAVGRLEIAPRNSILASKVGPAIRPYLFVAGGLGRINRPTIIEPDSIRAAAMGVGASIAFLKPNLQATVEYARGFSSYAPLDKVDHIGFTATLRI